MEKVMIVMGIVMLVLTITVAVWVIIDHWGKYECIDVQGNEIICTYVQMEKSGAWGTTEDGRRIQLISYKKVGKGE